MAEASMASILHLALRAAAQRPFCASAIFERVSADSCASLSELFFNDSWACHACPLIMGYLEQLAHQQDS